MQDRIVAEVGHVLDGGVGEGGLGDDRRIGIAERIAACRTSAAGIGGALAASSPSAREFDVAEIADVDLRSGRRGTPEPDAPRTR